MHVAVIFLDYSKAFDMVNHEMLVSKLNSFGLSPTAVKLIKSYLHNRTQQVKIKDTYSDQIKVKHGVPQGSILGPLLFLL